MNWIADREVSHLVEVMQYKAQNYDLKNRVASLEGQIVVLKEVIAELKEKSWKVS